jgi:hypothetical protein
VAKYVESGRLTPKQKNRKNGPVTKGLRSRRTWFKIFISRRVKVPCFDAFTRLVWKD